MSPNDHKYKQTAVRLSPDEKAVVVEMAATSSLLDITKVIRQALKKFAESRGYDWPADGGLDELPLPKRKA